MVSRLLQSTLLSRGAALGWAALILGAGAFAGWASQDPGRAASLAPAQVPGPSSWALLDQDNPFGCSPAELHRDVGTTYWASEAGYLHLRMCTAGVPGWQANGTGWEDARYKWVIGAGGAQYMLLVEDYPGARAGLSDPDDGRGEVTLIDDRNGNSRFTDDWAASVPPAYLTNSIGSATWRRALSGTTGQRQASSQGHTSDVGFRLGMAACGPVVDVYVKLAVLGSPDRATVFWATDNETADLDTRPGCDSGPGPQSIRLANEPSPSATTRRSTATPTPDVIVPSATPVPSDTAKVPTETATPTVTTEPSPTDLPPTLTSTSTATDVPTVGPPEATDTPTATGTTAIETATATLAASSTPVNNTPTATSTAEPSPTATATPSPGVIPPSATPTVAPTETATPVGPSPTSTSTATAVPSLAPPGGGLSVCALAMIGNEAIPFPEPATAHAVLLTPMGTPAQPPFSQSIAPNGCAAFAGLEAGLYRVSVTVPTGWIPFAGSPLSQTIYVNGAPPPSRAIFRFQRSSCPPPCPGGGAGGGIPTPPGPPTPPGQPGATAGPPGPPLVPPPTAYPDSPRRPNVGAAVHLPILAYLGNDPVCGTWIEAQNIGDRPAKAIVIAWGAPGFCPPQCAGPLKVECSGLLAPGSAWNFLGAQVPRGAKSGVVISANVTDIGHDIFADALCEALYFNVVGNCDEYRRFRYAYDSGGRWREFDFGAEPLQPLAVEVLRDCPGDLRPNVRVTSSYAGIAGEYLGHWDPVFGGFGFYAPSLYASFAGFNSFIYVQNGGLECTSVELWFKAQNDCLRARICDILTLAPGETYQFDVGSCLPPGWVGGAWIRTSQPMAVAVDQIGNDVLMTYTGMPAELKFTFEGTTYFTTGSEVAFGPLVYSEYQGWDSAITVQNLSGTTAAKVKVYFLDRSGGIITTIADWVCARGTQTFFLPVIAALPGNWVGSVRVESQGWFTAGGPYVDAPNIHAVAELLQYTDVARSDVQEGIAYNLLSEDLAFDWQLGSGPGGTSSGVARLGIPSFLKDRAGTGVTSEIAIANIVPKPGFTNFAVFIHDQNGLIDYLCETLSSSQVEYINLATWGFINPGFKGSAVISATFWEHDVFDSQGGFVRNLVGLAAVKVERTGTTLGSPIPGDESAGNIAFPIPGPFAFAGPSAPRCPGAPGGGGPPAPP